MAQRVQCETASVFDQALELIERRDREKDYSPLTPQEQRLLFILNQRANRARRLHPNSEVELSRYTRSLMRLED